MTNAIVVPDTFKTPPAPVFQGVKSEGELSGGITGGYGLIKYRGKTWSIQYHGNSMNLMRDDGDGPRGSIDVVILNANRQLSKTWYENGWDENNTNPPDCASANGIVPDQGVPKKQNDICATCKKNEWGSDPKGGKGKACGDHRRLAVVPITDLRNETFGGPMLLRCPAASLQDLAAFDSRYDGMGYKYFTMAVKIGFDTQESFPKFVFQAIRPLSQDEGVVVMELRGSPETARVIAEGSAPAVAEAAPAASPAFLEAPPVNAIQPQVVASPAPVAATPAPQPQPAPTVPAGPANTGNGARPAPASAGGFGPVAPAQANPSVAQPAKPAVQMTGFGNVTTLPQQVTAPATGQITPAAGGFGPAVEKPTPAPVTPGVVSAFEGSIDDRLNALLGE